MKKKVKKEKKLSTPWYVTFRNHFIAGLFVVVPIILTIFIVYKVFVFFDQHLTFFFKNRFDLRIPPYGSGFIVTITVIAFIGMLTKNLLGKKFIGLFERLFYRLPVVNRIYNALKQVSNAILGKNKNVFQRVILFEYPRKGIYSIGFVTSEDKTKFHEITGEELLHVFLPTTPNPTSGFLLFIPVKETIPLSLGVEDAMKLIISGGVMIPDSMALEQINPEISE